MKYLAPSIGQYLVFVNVFEDLHLIPATVNIKPILVSHKTMVSSRLWRFSFTSVHFDVLAVRIHHPFFEVVQRHCYLGSDFDPGAIFDFVLK